MGCLASAAGQAAEPPNAPLQTDASTADFDRTETRLGYALSYRWRHDGREWRAAATVPRDAYRAARERRRSLTAAYRQAMACPTVDRLCTTVRGPLTLVESPVERASIAASFCQQRTYRSDGSTPGAVDYPQYSVETLVANGGDCEDLAVLMAGVLARLAPGSSPTLLFFTDHVGVGLAPGWFGAEPPGIDSRSVGDRRYVYVDPTNSLPVGAVPEEWEGEPLIAAYDGAWRDIDLPALVDHAGRLASGGILVDPRRYL